MLRRLFLAVHGRVVVLVEVLKATVSVPSTRIRRVSAISSRASRVSRATRSPIAHGESDRVGIYIYVGVVPACVLAENLGFSTFWLQIAPSLASPLGLPSRGARMR